jgi:16S rRNA (cytidine1402-2'-O)-methyltransferase
LLDALANTLSPDALISIGADLTLPSQLIKTRSAKNWRGKSGLIKDRLVVFGIGF